MLSNAYDMIPYMQAYCPNRQSSACHALKSLSGMPLLSRPCQGLTVALTAVQEEDDEVGWPAIPDSSCRLEQWHTYLLNDSVVML